MDTCGACGGPIETGAVSWSGDPLYWNTGEREDRQQLRAEELLAGPVRRLDHPELPARRCTTCRTIFLDY